MEKYLDMIEEIVPQEVISKYKFIGRKEAFKKIHFPDKIEEAKVAKKYFAFEEIFLLELFIISKKVCNSLSFVTDLFKIYQGKQVKLISGTYRKLLIGI